MSMTTPDPKKAPPQQPQSGAGGPGITLTGGAAILAPITAFPNGVPSNAMVLIPLGSNSAPIEKEIVKGPVALQIDEVWKLLGFNGPAVQVPTMRSFGTRLVETLGKQLKGVVLLKRKGTARARLYRRRSGPS
jgi:hypothetical protein